MVAFADQTLTSVGLLRYYALLHGKADTGTSAGGCTAGLSFGYVPFPAIPFPLAPHGDSPPAVAVAARRRSSTIIFRQLGRQPAKRPTRSGQGPPGKEKRGLRPLEGGRVALQYISDAGEPPPSAYEKSAAAAAAAAAAALWCALLQPCKHARTPTRRTR